MSLLASIFSTLSLLAPPPTVVAAGDIASCSSTGDEATAALVARIPGTVAILGDAVYDRGTTAEFEQCYSWRRFRSRHARGARESRVRGQPGPHQRARTSGSPPWGTSRQPHPPAIRSRYALRRLANQRHVVYTHAHAGSQ